MEVVPLPDIAAEIVGKAFYEHWIYRFGVPATIITDQGRQFESQLFRKIAAICGSKVGHTTPYHPQCNGKVECLHRTLKGALKAHNNIKWTESVSTVLLKPAYLLEPDHDDGQTTAEHKNATPNYVDPHLMPDKQPITSPGKKINRPVRFRE
ncbi:retrovirus-related Pol polyprotein from transposon opus [Nephila pilipes]|uniref:Retrovirus-related Pol polyprotein from transposon opus n=1 Tax=Nephila pilipes TaxID=299642 RepID=A0A8X6P2C6_NEPPI|nr:retrovirus-related Pol polyprotein from transposon opus [Nephila pilipes]